MTQTHRHPGEDVQHVMIGERQKEGSHGKTDDTRRKRLTEPCAVQRVPTARERRPSSNRERAERAKNAHQERQEEEQSRNAEFGTNLQIAIMRRFPLHTFST